MKSNTHILRDPACGKKISPNKAYAKVKYGKETYYLCCPICQAEFEKEPGKFIVNLKM